MMTLRELLVSSGRPIAKKRQRTTYNCAAPSEIAKGTSAYVQLAFKGAGFGGTLSYVVRDKNYNDLGTIKLKIS